MSELDYDSYVKILHDSEKLFDHATIMDSIASIAAKLNEQIQQEKEIPVFLTLMQGGMMFATHAMSYINHPIELDYNHVSRYHDQQYGSVALQWIKTPNEQSLKGRNVYVLDDILDEGFTLKEIKKFVLEQCRAKSCKLVVLIDKKIPQEKKLIGADVVGLIAPHKFLYGFGMDLKGIYRNLPDVYIYPLSY
jgi:hypoxanthine phosphoribosyltransferase